MSSGSTGLSFSLLITFFTFLVRRVGSADLLWSGCLRSGGRAARAEAGSVGTFLGSPPRSRSFLGAAGGGLSGVGFGTGFCTGFCCGSRGAAGALNFDDISGRGTATTGLDAFFMLKLNLFGVCDCGPEGGARLTRGISSSFVFSEWLVSSTCKSLLGLKGFSVVSSIGMSSEAEACAVALLGEGSLAVGWGSASSELPEGLRLVVVCGLTFHCVLLKLPRPPRPGPDPNEPPRKLLDPRLPRYGPLGY